MEKKIRYIHTVFGNINHIVSENKRNAPEVLMQKGYTLTEGKGYDHRYVIVNGMYFYLSFYTSNYTWNLSYGLETKHGTTERKYHSIYDVRNNISEILCEGVTIPASFPEERSRETKDIIEKIKTSILETRKAVSSFRDWGCIGERLRILGYRVTYDGGSVCEFNKEGICYCAHTANKPGWELEDYYNAYFPDNNLSDRFSLDRERYLKLEQDFEAIFGESLTDLGHYVTEKEALKTGKIKYDHFRVRQCSSKYLSTLGVFDTFDEANKFAYEQAKKKAAEVAPDLRRYANPDPKDCGEKYDYLAMYIYYQYENSKHLVFVQGEND